MFFPYLYRISSLIPPFFKLRFAGIALCTSSDSLKFFPQLAFVWVYSSFLLVIHIHHFHFVMWRCQQSRYYLSGNREQITDHRRWRQPTKLEEALSNQLIWQFSPSTFLQMFSHLASNGCLPSLLREISLSLLPSHSPISFWEKIFSIYPQVAIVDGKEKTECLIARFLKYSSNSIKVNCIMLSDSIGFDWPRVAKM